MRRLLNKPGDTTPLSEGLFRKYFKNSIDERKRVVRGYSYDDGSCLWHALVVCKLQGDRLRSYGRGSAPTREEGLELRRHVASKITKRSWSDFWENKMKVAQYPTRASILKKFENPSTWSDVWMILFAAHVLDVNIVFFVGRENQIYCGLPMDTSRRTLLVYWSNYTHFEPVIVLDRDGKPLLSELPTPRSSEGLGSKVAAEIFDEHQDLCADVGLDDILPFEDV